MASEMEKSGMVRIGIVGCGRILNAHLQGLLKLRQKGMDNFRVTALVARRAEDGYMFRRRGEGPTPRPPVLDPSTGDPLAAPHTYVSDLHTDVEAKVYTDYKEMMASGEVDAVVDTSPLDLHHQVAAVALDAGLHMHTQKPLAISVRAAQRMVNSALDQKLVLGTFENVRQGKFARAAAWAVQTGRIGTPQMAVSGSLGGLWSPTRVVAETPWRHQKLRAGGGGTIDIGVHQFHLLRYVFGEVDWVSAYTPTLEPLRYQPTDKAKEHPTVANVDDTHLATFGFDSGAMGQLLWSWALHGPEISLAGTPAFYGSEGAIFGGQLYSDKGTKAALVPLFEESLTAAENEQYFPLGLTDGFAIQGWDFLRAIAEGRQIETSGREGLHDLACSFAMIESSHAKRHVTLAEILNNSEDAYQREIDEHYGLL